MPDFQIGQWVSRAERGDTRRAGEVVDVLRSDSGAAEHVRVRWQPAGVERWADPDYLRIEPPHA